MKNIYKTFLHVWKAIDHTVLLALSYFPYIFLVSTDKYLPHTVLDCKVIDPQAATSSYAGPHYSSRFLSPRGEHYLHDIMEPLLNAEPES